MLFVNPISLCWPQNWRQSFPMLDKIAVQNQFHQTIYPRWNCLLPSFFPTHLVTIKIWVLHVIICNLMLNYWDWEYTTLFVIGFYSCYVLSLNACFSASRSSTIDVRLGHQWHMWQLLWGDHTHLVVRSVFRL